MWTLVKSPAMKHNTHTALELVYQDRSLSGFAWQDAQEHNQWCVELGLSEISDTETWGTDFIMPQEYASLDVEEYVAVRCPPDDRAMARVAQELAEFNARNLYDMLRLMIYIVDTLRKNNVVWGVGRGSSVASYVLYLIGVHRIDSLKYELELDEFLR